MIFPAHQTKAEWDAFLSSKSLVYARDTEFENANKAIPRFYNHLGNYFREHLGLQPDVNICHSLYLDTRKYDLLTKGECSLRDRSGGSTSQGEEFEDEIGLKFIQTKFQRAANLATHHLFREKDFAHLALNEKDRMRIFAKVRKEIERRHRCPRNVGEYRFFELPLDIRNALKARMPAEGCENMVFVPQFKTIAHRTRFLVFLNARASAHASEFFLPAKTADEAKKFVKQFMAMEIGFDRCEYGEGKPGMNIAEILEAPKSGLKDLGRRDNKLIVENEYKGKYSSNLTNGSMIRTYTRFMIAMYEKALPFVTSDEPEPFQPSGSKHARGVKAKVTGDQAFEMIGNIWVYSP